MPDEVVLEQPQVSEDDKNAMIVRLSMLNAAQGGAAVGAEQLRMLMPAVGWSKILQPLYALAAEGRVSIERAVNPAGVTLEKFRAVAAEGLV